MSAISLPPLLLQPLRTAVMDEMRRREPDKIIGGEDNPYLLRWHLVERNRESNVYAHEFRRSDDDRAHHDHPWESCSIVLFGRYFEHAVEAGGIHVRKLRNAGDVISRSATAAHRIELLEEDRARGLYPRTLFLTGAVVRDWGFHCPERGWVHWEIFTNPADGGATIGRGCEA